MCVCVCVFFFLNVLKILKARSSNVPGSDFHLSWTVRLQNSSILKVEHTKGKFPIKILIKFNPSAQSSVTNCLVSAALASTFSSRGSPDSSCVTMCKADWDEVPLLLVWFPICVMAKSVHGCFFFLSSRKHCCLRFTYLCTYILKYKWRKWQLLIVGAAVSWTVFNWLTHQISSTVTTCSSGDLTYVFMLSYITEFKHWTYTQATPL